MHPGVVALSQTWQRLDAGTGGAGPECFQAGRGEGDRGRQQWVAQVLLPQLGSGLETACCLAVDHMWEVYRRMGMWGLSGKRAG